MTDAESSRIMVNEMMDNLTKEVSGGKLPGEVPAGDIGVMTMAITLILERMQGTSTDDKRLDEAVTTFVKGVSEHLAMMSLVLMLHMVSISVANDKEVDE